MLRHAIHVVVLVALLSASGCKDRCLRTLKAPCRVRDTTAGLVAKLRDGSPHVRRRAAELLRTDEGVPEQALRPLIRAMMIERDERAHGAMLLTLARAGVPEALPHIDATFRTGDGDGYRYAADALWAWRYANGLEVREDRPDGWPYPRWYRRP